VSKRPFDEYEQATNVVTPMTQASFELMPPIGQQIMNDSLKKLGKPTFKLVDLSAGNISNFGNKKAAPFGSKARAAGTGAAKGKGPDSPSDPSNMEKLRLAKMLKAKKGKK
jgi:hypothetical protein